MSKAENVESITNLIQLGAIAPGPQKPYMQILLGQAGAVGSLADLVEKVKNKKATLIDVFY